MLEGVDLSQKLSRTSYKQQVRDLEIRLSRLQRAAIREELPIILVFDGWEGAGKGTIINRLIRALDPRHFKVHSIQRSRDETLRWPFLWRFWRKLPARGRMALFDRSWYVRVLHDRADKAVSKKEWKAACDEIDGFERLLVGDGYLIVKLFLHITKKEQRHRLQKLGNNPATSWRITKYDWTQHRRYKKFARAVEAVFARPTAVPWNVIEANDRRFATVKVFEVVSDAIDGALASPASAQPLVHTIGKPLNLRSAEPLRPAGSDVIHFPPRGIPIDDEPMAGTADRHHKAKGGSGINLLDAADLSKSLPREEYDVQLRAYRTQMRVLEHVVYATRVPVIIVYEGWDAAGKGGNIRRLTQSLDPRGYDVVPVGPPTEEEKRYPYLWRFWRGMPKAGHVTIFDRSWYGRVLVERVEGFARNDEWMQAYDQINDMEAQFVRAGAVVVKFWLHIDKETQLERFEERQRAGYKNWKITEEDWRNREKWDQYELAVRDMLRRTHTGHAPWTVVESNCKQYARLKAQRTVIRALQRRVAQKKER